LAVLAPFGHGALPRRVAGRLATWPQGQGVAVNTAPCRGG
jgi:hypothetical protein